MTQSVPSRVEFNGANVDDLEYYGDTYLLAPDADNLELTGLAPPPTPNEEVKVFLLVEGRSVKLIHNSSASPVGHRFFLRDPDSTSLSFVGADRILYAGVPYWLVYSVDGPLGAGYYGEGTGTAYTLARAVAHGAASDPTYSTNSYAVIPEMTATLTTYDHDVMLDFTMSAALEHLDDFTVALFCDGTLLEGSERRVSFVSATGAGVTLGSIPGAHVSIAHLAQGISAGSHTFDARWIVAAGSARANGTMRTLRAVEVE